MTLRRFPFHRTEFKEIVTLALPMIGTQVAWMALPFIDTVVVGQLGKAPLAALGISSTYYTFLIVIILGILSAINPMVTHLLGEDDPKEIRSVLHSGVIVGVALTLVMLLALYLGPAALRLLHQPEELIAPSQIFLWTLMLGAPAQVGSVLLRQLLDATSNPRPVMYLVFGGALLNLLLDFGFVFGYWGFPRLEIMGAALATSIIHWLIFFSMILVVACHPKLKGLHLLSRFTAKSKHIKEILRLGLPSSGSMISEVGYFCGSTWVAGFLGTTLIAAHQIAINLATIAFMVPLGLGFAVSIRVGYYAGIQNRPKVKETVELGLLITLATQCFNILMILSTRQWILPMYTSDKEVQLIAHDLLNIACVFQLFDGLQVFGINTLRGLKDTKIPFINTLVGFWGVGSTISWMLCFKFQMGLSGIWWGMVASLALTSALHFWRLYRLAWCNLR